MAKAKTTKAKTTRAATTTAAKAAGRPLRVLMAASEAVPFAKTGGLGDVVGTLPAALMAAGVQASVVLPRYGSIAAELLEGEEPLAELTVPMPGGDLPCAVSRVSRGGVDFFLLAEDGYFGRDHGLYGYIDDGERFAFFSRAVCEAVARVPEMACDVVHCNDWQTALIPVYLRERYADVPACAGMKTIFTVHNAKFQGAGPLSMLADVTGLQDRPVALISCTTPDSTNLMKGALTYTDYVTTVSPTYVEELQRAPYGEGLESFFQRRSATFGGILNGIDQEAWNPATDPYIAEQFDAAHLEGKAACKAALQQEMGIDQDPGRPLVAMVTRLTDQKGVGMVCQVMDRLMSRGLQLVVLGTGDPAFECQLAAFASRYPHQVGAAIKFDNALSHRIYAGADLFLMPSLFEPCGLSQMISMRYGTLPVVRETGGLKDSVVPYNKYTGEGNGFSFANADADEMADILLDACEVYWTNPLGWAQLRQQAFASDFTWDRAARRYLQIYRGIL